MNQFPLDIINRILAYDGRIKCRNGKYMNQIAPDDDRYKMLKQMPQIASHNSGYMSSHKNKFYIYKYTTPYSGQEPLINIFIYDTAHYYYYMKDRICISHVFLE